MAQANARQWQRFSYRADVQLRWGAAPAPEDRAAGGRAINLSEGGLQLRAPEAPAVGAAVSCELSCAGRWTSLPGRVRWRSHPPQTDLGTELGIEFGPLSLEQSESLQALLASLDSSGETVELSLPALHEPLPARAVMSDRGVRLRARLPLLELGAELDFELADPPLKFSGRVVSCQLHGDGDGWEVELLVEEREPPRSRLYTMYPLAQPRSRGVSRRSTLHGATHPISLVPSTAVAQELEPASPALAAQPVPLRALTKGAAKAALPAAELQPPSAARASEREQRAPRDQSRPIGLTASNSGEQDTDEYPSIPKARAPRLISQLLAVLLGFSVAITLGRSALRQREEDEAAAHDEEQDAPDGSETRIDAVFDPALAMGVPAALPVAAAAPIERTTPAEAAPSAPASAASASAPPTAATHATATATSDLSRSAAHSGVAMKAIDAADAPAPEVADGPTLRLDGDSTEVFVPMHGALAGWRDAVWSDPPALVIDLPATARVPFPRQRYNLQSAGVTYVSAVDLRGVTQLRVFLDAPLGRYAIAALERGFVIRLQRDLRPLP
jgi:hypothetical protein